MHNWKKALCIYFKDVKIRCKLHEENILFPAKLRVYDDSVNGSPKGVVLFLGSLKNSVDIRAIGAGDFTAMGVADEFTNDALEDAFLVSHEGCLECGQVAYFTAIG